MKRLFAIILSTALLAGLLAGCSSGTSTSSSASTSASASASASSAKPVSISLWVFPQYEGYGDMLKEKYTAAVTAKSPNVTLNIELLSWDAGPEKLTVAMATKATPDFMQDGLSRLAPAIAGNLCADVTDVMGKVKNVLMTNYQKEGMKDGKNYYLATNTNDCYCIAVNVTLAKELGVYSLLPADKLHWSYAQFLDFCRKAAAAGRAKNIFATQLWAGSRSSDAAYYSMLMTGGTKILNADHTKVAANSATAEATLTMLKTLIDEKLVPDGAATIKDEAVYQNWESGKTVLYMTGGGTQTPALIYNKTKSGDIKGFECDTVQFPTPDGKADPYVATWGTNGFVIFKNDNDAAKIQATKDAIEVWFNTPAINTELCLKGGQIPTVNNITMDYGDATLNAQAKLSAENNAKYSTSDFGILEPWWSNFRETFYIQLQAFYTGTKTAKQMLADWETAGNAVIAKAAASK